MTPWTLDHVVSELRKRRRLFQLLQRRQCPQADVPTGVLEPALDIEECVHFVLTTRAQFLCQSETERAQFCVLVQEFQHLELFFGTEKIARFFSHEAVKMFSLFGS